MATLEVSTPDSSSNGFSAKNLGLIISNNPLSYISFKKLFSNSKLSSKNSTNNFIAFSPSSGWAACAAVPKLSIFNMLFSDFVIEIFEFSLNSTLVLFKSLFSLM